MERFHIEAEDLAQYGENTARTLSVRGRLSPRRETMALREVLRRLLSLKVEESESSREAMEWLRGNEFLLRQSYALVRDSLAGCSPLRRCGRKSLLTELCRSLLAAGTLSEERLCAFLGGFQQQLPLEQRELGHLTDGLRVAAIELLAEELGREVPSPETVGELFTALRSLGSPVWGEIVARCDPVEQCFQKDPAGIYPRMDEHSRRDYRRAAEVLAKRSGLGENAVAEAALSLSESGCTPEERHIGYWLFRRPMGKSPSPSRGGGYIALQVLPTLFVSLRAGFLTGSIPAAALLLLPVSELVKGLWDGVLSRLSPPRRLPRLELSGGIPPEGKTLCVLSVLLQREEDGVALARRLEELALAEGGRSDKLLFGLLCDLPERKTPVALGDEALLNAAAEAVEQLNLRCGGGFYLFTRPRRLSPDGDRYTGWERKRGALLSLGRLLSGEDSEIVVSAGESRALKDTVYILTLDGDTRPLPGSIRELIGTALHPLNRPVVDREHRLVVQGYGVLQPRLSLRPGDGSRNLFTRIYAPPGGCDPYGGCAGELYMDRFDSGGFAGKGLLHISGFLQCMEGRIPENRVLSHDALEGAFLRGGLVDDAEFTDGFPGSFFGYWSRQHRWIRGDWQNLPWLFSPGRALPPMERWRLFDSLRRSLCPVGYWAALSVGLFLPEGARSLLTGVTLAALFYPLLRCLWRGLFRPVQDARQVFISSLPRGLRREALGCLVRLAFLPWEALVSLSAAGLALWRMTVSHRKLLEWRTAAEDDRGKSGAASLRSMALPTGWGLVLLLLCPALPGRALGLLWLCQPLLLRGLEHQGAEKPTLSPEDRAFLLTEAGKLLRYFREHCTSEEHYLPPDNRQLSPPLGIAHRTSPTNMGFALLSFLSGADLGLISPAEAVASVEKLLTTMEALPRWRGHFYNWYDTRTLLPLPPGYVSSVDSGNLCAALLASAAALDEYGHPAMASRCRVLARGMELFALYDPARRLFRIGLVPGGKADESWYDLLESEARLLSYTAIALGQAELRHWRALGRAQTCFRGHRGMVSWSGSLFEYAMPSLLLPEAENSHLWESTRYAVLVQQHCRDPRTGL